MPRVSEALSAEEEPSMKSVTKMNDARKDDRSNGAQLSCTALTMF